MLWAVLAAIAINGGELDTAESSLAAINEVDKLHFIQSIKSIPRSAAASELRVCGRKQTFRLFS